MLYATVQLDALRYFINKDVDMATEDYDGMKPLDLARDNNHDECVKALFKTVKTNILVSFIISSFCPFSSLHLVSVFL